MRKIVCTILLLFFIVFIGLSYLFFKITPIDNDKSYGVIEIIYYLFCSFGSLFTMFAVLVALFNNEIRAIIFRQRCSIDIENLSEDLVGEEDDLRAQNYNCYVRVCNIGNRTIEDCKLVLSELKYKKKNKKDYQEIKINSNRNFVFWGQPNIEETTIYKGETKRVPLFKIYPKKLGEGTPDKNSELRQYINIMGCHLSDSENKSGTWLATYNLRTRQSVLCEFTIEIFWEGQWCNRLPEMKKEITITRKKSK